MKNLLLLLCIIPTSVFSQLNIAAIKENIVGLWQFEELYVKKNNAGQTEEPCTKATTYLFKKDGSVSVENTDKTNCAYGNYTMLWSVIKLHDEKGKEHFALRLTDEPRAERESYDGNTFTDEIYMVMVLKENHLSWIPKPQYTRPSANEVQYRYKKIK